MNQPKFTNGPWTTGNGTENNASLIAAAPDMYTACEIVLNNLVEKPLEPMGYLAYKASIDALVAALKKARGESC